MTSTQVNEFSQLEYHDPISFYASASRQWFGKNTNLHSVWDSELLKFEGLSFEQVSFLDHVSKSDMKQWQNSHYFDWAKESKGHRQSVCNYGDQYSLNLPNLKYTYVSEKKQILKNSACRGAEFVWPVS